MNGIERKKQDTSSISASRERDQVVVFEARGSSIWRTRTRTRTPTSKQASRIPASIYVFPMPLSSQRGRVDSAGTRQCRSRRPSEISTIGRAANRTQSASILRLKLPNGWKLASRGGKVATKGRWESALLFVGRVWLQLQRLISAASDW